MEDDRVWAFEESLWTASPDHYARSIDAACLMALPAPPHVFSGEESIRAVQATPRWSEVELSQRRVSRPEEGLIVIAYHARASRGEEAYEAHCTSVYRRLAHDVWKVVPHSQLPPLTQAAKASEAGG